MSLVRNAIIRSNTFLARIKPNRASPLLHHRHHFSTEDLPPSPTPTTEPAPTPTPTPTPMPTLDSSVESFLQPPRKVMAYGRISGIGRHTLRTDIVNMLDNCGLSPQDVRVEYNRSLTPLSMIVQFPSPPALEHAMRIMRTKRFHKLDRVDRSVWDYQRAYEGKFVALQGIPLTAQLEDIERLLSGCEFNASNIQLFTRQTLPEPTKVAVVQFPSQVEAMNAVTTKNRGFCLNNQITMRVLQ